MNAYECESLLCIYLEERYADIFRSNNVRCGNILASILFTFVYELRGKREKERAHTVNILIRSNATNCITSIAFIQFHVMLPFERIFHYLIWSCCSQAFAFILRFQTNWTSVAATWHLFFATFTLNIHQFAGQIQFIHCIEYPLHI